MPRLPNHDARGNLNGIFRAFSRSVLKPKHTLHEIHMLVAEAVTATRRTVYQIFSEQFMKYIFSHGFHDMQQEQLRGHEFNGNAPKRIETKIEIQS